MLTQSGVVPWTVSKGVLRVRLHAARLCDSHSGNNMRHDRKLPFMFRAVGLFAFTKLAPNVFAVCSHENPWGDLICSLSACLGVVVFPREPLER